MAIKVSDYKWNKNNGKIPEKLYLPDIKKLKRSNYKWIKDGYEWQK